MITARTGLRPPLRLVACLILLAAGSSAPARADVVYYADASGSNDFIPFENDGTPNRPVGDHLGNTITLAGTSRYLTAAQIVLASVGPREMDTYTIDLYRNDGALDPNGSGLHQPGTLIASFSTVASNTPIPGFGGYGVNFSFAPTLVPDTFTAVLSSSYSTTTPGQLMGPFASVNGPLVGSGVNTVWYGSGAPGGWVADPNWAIADGAVTNFFDMNFTAQPFAVPEPSSLALAGLGLAAVLARRHRRVG